MHIAHSIGEGLSDCQLENSRGRRFGRCPDKTQMIRHELFVETLEGLWLDECTLIISRRGIWLERTSIFGL